MSNVIEMRPVPIEPTPRYSFHLGECVLWVGSWTIGMYVVLTGLFAAFQIWSGL